MNSSAARRAQAAAARLISRIVSAGRSNSSIPIGLDPNVLVSMMSAPASKILPMDLRHGFGTGKAEDIDKVLQVLVVIRQTRPPHGRLVDPQGKNRRSHGPVQDQDALTQQLFQLVANRRSRDCWHTIDFKWRLGLT